MAREIKRGQAANEMLLSELVRPRAESASMDFSVLGSLPHDAKKTELVFGSSLAEEQEERC